MNLYKQNRSYGIYILSTLAIFFIASCGPPAGIPGATLQVTPAVTPEVAYGASLSEWEEAKEANAEEANTEETNTDEAAIIDEPSDSTQSTSPVADSASTSSLESPETADAETADAETADAEITEAEIGVPFRFDDVLYREIMWDGLIPMDFTGKAITARYQAELDSLESGSQEKSDLYAKMQEEYNEAPINEVLNEVEVRIPGFVTPLEYDGDIITEFLLVPNLGACIHVPPPPVNQTVLVKTAEGQGIKIADSYRPIWVMGKIVTESTTTELASAGYNIKEAIIEPYESSQD